MKTIYTSVLAMAISFAMQAQIVNIPDANFKAALVANNNINTNGDSEIQLNEATAYNGSIYCPGQGITNLTGIEAFINLTELHCGFNSITTLNLAQNNALTSLNCMFNQLTSLNISNLTLLNELVCTGNQLNTLNVSNNTALVHLFCGANQLAGMLDLSSHSSLVSLNCYNNQLTGLNVKNGNNVNVEYFFVGANYISCIQVDNVAYSLANWSGGGTFGYDANVTFSENCAAPPCIVTIPDANFKNYLLGNSSINTNGDSDIQCSEAQAYTGFIICEALNITDLSGIEFFTGITALNCNNNQLTSLDLSSNTALTQLYCGYNQLTSLNISGNTNLIGLFCNNNSLASLDVSNNTAIEDFHCYNNPLTALNLNNNTALKVMVCCNTKLTNLNLSNNPVLENFNCCDNQLLNSLNVANGNNANFTYFGAQNNPSLSCIQVDNVAYSMTNWFNIDAGTSFSQDCSGNSAPNPPSNLTATLESDGSLTLTWQDNSNDEDGFIFYQPSSLGDTTGAWAQSSYQFGANITSYNSVTPFNGVDGLHCFKVLATKAGMMSAFSNVDCVVKGSLNIGENTANKLPRIYPNPANSILYVEAEETTTIKIINLLGATVAMQIMYEGNNNIDVSCFSNGVYFIQASNGKITKFVKE